MKFLRRKEGCILSDHKWNEEILEELKVGPVDVNLKKIAVKLTTKCNKNEQHHDAKSDPEL
jgi:hypothetical protein